MMAPTMKRPVKPLRGRAVLFALIGFFAFIAAVNGVFITLALRSHPGLSEANAYQSGLDYNRVLAEAEAQRRLGWTVSITLDDETRGVTLRLMDAADKPLAVSSIAAHLRRPGTDSADRDLVFTAIGGGSWRADLRALSRGNWDLQVDIAQANGTAYRGEWRLWLKEGSKP